MDEPEKEPRVHCVHMASGHYVVELRGMLDSDIYPKGHDQPSFFDEFSDALRLLERYGKLPIAIDVSNARFHGANPVGLLAEAYKISGALKLPVVCNDREANTIKHTGLTVYLDLYKSMDEIPISSR